MLRDQICTLIRSFAEVVQIQDLRLESIFVAKFSISEDKKRGEQRASWLINSLLMVIREWDTGQSIEELAFSSVFIWDHIRNNDLYSDVKFECIMRSRVKVNLNNSLPKGYMSNTGQKSVQNHVALPPKFANLSLTVARP